MKYFVLFADAFRSLHIRPKLWKLSLSFDIEMVPVLGNSQMDDTFPEMRKLIV